MPRVTIIGAGVFGLSIAHALPLSYEVTIVARNMPGDEDSLEWASPWAGAGFGGGNADDADILKASFRWLWEVAERHPESSVKKITEHLFRDDTDTDEDLWWKDWMPDVHYRVLDPSELPPDSRAKIAIAHTGLVLNPPVYIAWLRARLEARGVRFVRATVRALSDLADGARELGPVPDVIVNATGVGARTLGGVEDPDVEPIRGQTMLIADPEMKLDKLIIRAGTDYCYIIPRLDGTVVLGGIKEPNDPSPEPKPELRHDICRRAHELNPLVPASPDALTVLKDIVGFRPGRTSGLRVQAEVSGGGLRVVHAYGGGGGGFALSAGVGRRVAGLVDGLLQTGKPTSNAASDFVPVASLPNRKSCTVQ